VCIFYVTDVTETLVLVPYIQVLDLSIGREEFSRRERKRGAMGYNGIKELSTALLRGGKKL
jgi:hypothetical protein